MELINVIVSFHLAFLTFMTLDCSLDNDLLAVHLINVWRCLIVNSASQARGLARYGVWTRVVITNNKI